MVHVNMTAVLVAVVISFIFGWLWYGPILGKTWGKEMGMAMDQKPPAGVMIRGMILMLVGTFLTAWVFAHNAEAWKALMSTQPPMSAVQNGFMGGFFTWLGFFLPHHLSRLAWENKSMKLFWINAVYSLLFLQIVSQTLSHMG